VTSVRFAGPLTEAIKGSELVVFEGCSHAPIYENVADFNARTMDFLTRNS
jgi:pimeloyl-ACP methyl ester carboxylesterase